MFHWQWLYTRRRQQIQNHSLIIRLQKLFYKNEYNCSFFQFLRKQKDKHEQIQFFRLTDNNNQNSCRQEILTALMLFRSQTFAITNSLHYFETVRNVNLVVRYFSALVEKREKYARTQTLRHVMWTHVVCTKLCEWVFQKNILETFIKIGCV